MASKVKTFNENAFIKWSVDTANYLGKVTKIGIEEKSYIVQLPSGQEALVAFDAAKESSEAEFTDFVKSTISTLLASVQFKMYTQEEFDAVKTSYDKIVADMTESKKTLDESLAKATAELTKLTEELSVMQKSKIAVDRYEDLVALKAVNHVLDTEDRDQALTKLSAMSDSEFTIRKDMAAKWMRLTEQNQTNLAKTTQQTVTTETKSTDVTSAIETIIDEGKEEVVDEAVVAAAATAAAGDKTASPLKNVMSKYFTKSSE